MCNNNSYTMKTQGFTLVELSIVIIIIGFLIAGISSGRSLIKQAELNSIIKDFKTYQVSYYTFANLYGQPPGDFTAGDAIWPNCSMAHTACTGNGNGVIDSVSEFLAAWRELYLANIIPSAIIDPSTVGTTALSLIAGTNIPSSKLNGAGYMMIQGNESVISFIGFGRANGIVTGLWNDEKTNAVFIGTPIPPWYGGSVMIPFVGDGALSTIEAFNIDKKIDDGTESNGQFTGVASGNIRAFTGTGSAAELNHGCTSGFTPEYTIDSKAYAVDLPNGRCVTGMALN